MSAPAARATVLDALADSVAANPYGFAARAIDGGASSVLTYAQLHRAAGEAAAGLLDLGLADGDRMIVALPSSVDLLSVYLGALYIGAVPLLVREPSAARARDQAARMEVLVSATGARAVVARAAIADTLRASLSARVAAVEDLRATGAKAGSPPSPARGRAEAIAHLQATSGSTRAPRLVIVRHRNIAANVAAIGQAIGHRLDDVLLTWLPFSHDMGLIGLSYALYWQIPIVLADPSEFVRNPLVWPAWIGRFGATLSPAPNSAFQAAARLAKLRPPAGLDLSGWRVALCGAEPVHETTLRQFRAAFAPSGLREVTLLPVYGLAEATLAVTLSPAGEPFRVDRVDPERLSASGRAEPPAAGRALSVVCVGRAIAGHELRVVDGEGRPVPDRHVGEIEVSGPSVADGYWGDPGASAALVRPDGFLRTGDLGYLVDGALHIVGRHKDLIIVQGRNYSPDSIEAFVEELVASPVTPAVVAVGVEDRQLGTEQVHLLLDGRVAGGRDPAALIEDIRLGLARTFDLSGVGVTWVTAGQIPRTPSGKVQRFACRELIVRSAGEVGAGLRASEAGPRGGAQVTGDG